MPNGFTVQPEMLEVFRADVKKVADAYRLIVGQLTEARLGNQIAGLLGVPEALGRSGPPVEFTDASRTMLTAYDTLLGTLHDVHAVVLARFDYLHTALGETNELYTRLDGTHAGVFENLLGDSSSDED